MSGFWYLATPYSLYVSGRHAAFKLAAETRGLLIRAGVAVFSPVVHSHPVALYADMDPLDYSIWLPSERPILDCARGLILLRAPSWELSLGMREERAIFLAAGKPIVEMDVGVVPDALKGDSNHG